ncbi:hypothetical protein KIPB_008779, partial [Kipferlia bialata]|eukprot:g8779.t1
MSGNAGNNKEAEAAATAVSSIPTDVSLHEAVGEIIRTAQGAGLSVANHAACVTLRKSVSDANQDVNEDLDRLFQYYPGLLDQVVASLRGNLDDSIRLELLWFLTNVGSGNLTQAERLRDAGAFSVFATHCHYSNMAVAEQAVWAIGNILGEVPLKAAMIENGAPQGLHSYFLRSRPLMAGNTVARGNGAREMGVRGAGLPPDTFASFSGFTNCLWAMLNLYRGRPSGHTDDVLRDLMDTLIQSESWPIGKADEAVDAMWALSYAAEIDELQPMIMSHPGFMDTLFSILRTFSRDPPRAPKTYK